MTKDTEDIRIVSIEGENIRKLTTIAVRLNGEPGLYRITSDGENEEGKTTALDVVAMLFGGKKAVKPDTIQKGTDGGWARGKLTNGYSIDLRFTPKAPDGYLTVTTPDDNTQKAPQSLLDGWCGPHSFDPGALLKKRIKDIEAIILGLAADPDLKKKRETIATNRDKLTEDRRPWNSEKQRAERTKRPDGTRPKAVDVGGEMERLKRLQEDRQIRTAVENRIAANTTDINATQKDVLLLEGRLKEQNAALARLQGERAASKRSLESTADPTEAITAVESHIADADKVNAELGPWNDWDRAQAEVNEAGEKSAALTKQIKALGAKEEALLKAANIPVRGIGFAEDGSMVLDGHPIEVGSGMRRLDMTCDIAFAANSGVRVVLLDEANDYGIEALDNLHKRAKEKGWQVIAGRLGIEGPGEIIIQDGAATT